MKPQKATSDQLKFLSSMYQDETPLRGRIAILSAEANSSSDITNKIITFIEHTQSLCLFLLANYKAFGQGGDHNLHISTPLKEISRLLGPGNLLVFDSSHKDKVFSVLIFAFCFFIVRLLLFLYIVYLAIRKREGPKSVVAIWRFVFKVQFRIIYFLMASFWINTAQACFEDKMKLKSEFNNIVLAISTIMLVLEFLFSIFLQTQFEGCLPSKSFLASKSNVTEIITLVQKFFGQVVRRIFFSAPIASIWIHNVVHVIISAARLKYYLHFLPAYRIEALRYQAYFLVLAFCLNVACVAQNIFQDYPVNLDSVVIFWVILSLLLGRYTLNYLEKRILKLALTNEIQTPEALFHRLIIIKYLFKKMIVSSSTAGHLPENHLFATTLKENLAKTLSIYSENMKIDEFDFHDKEKRKESFTKYLENLLKKFPQNIQLRMYTAYYYAKKRKMYGLCIKTLSNLKNSSSWRVAASTAILFEKIKTIIQNDYQTKHYMFDIDEYTRSTSFIAKLKINIAAQAQFQIDLCQEIVTGTTGNLIQISKISQNAVKLKRTIEKDINKMLEWLPDYYLEPHMILAHYHLVLTHDYEKYLKFQQHYLKRIDKYEKIWQDPQFRIENLYQENAGVLIFSGENNRAGDIFSCGGNFDEIFGMNLAGMHMSSCTPPSLRFASAQKIKTSIEQGAKNIVNHIQYQFFYNIKGYMTKVRYYTNMNAYMTHGLVYYLIYQPMAEFQETILVDNEGFIESFTKGIGRKLGLLSRESGMYKHGEKHVRELNGEFEKINRAFHMAKIENMDEAQEICKLYTEKGAILTLNKINTKKEYRYHCKINSVAMNNNLLKFITLENAREEGDETSSESEIEEDEKRNGWIDLSKLRQIGSRSIERNNQESPKLYDLIPTSPASSVRKLLPTDPNFETIHDQFQKTLIKMKSTEEDEEVRVNIRKIEKLSLQEAEWLTSNRVQLSKAFERTLNRAYYPSFYRTFGVILCGLFVLILILEALMHSSVNSSIPNMRTSKDILEIAETKTRLLAEINSYTLSLYNYATGKIIISDYNAAFTPSFFISFIQNLLIEIETSDANMLDVVESLRTEDAEQFFNSDVRMFETYFDQPEQVSSNKTIFQGTSLIAQSAFKAVPFFVAESTYRQATPYLEFVIRNILNDILIKNQRVDESFQYNLVDKKEATLSVFMRYSIALFAVFVLIIVICGYLCYLQYTIEKRNLLSLLKLNKNSVKNMRGHIESFQALVNRNVNFLMTLNQESIPYLSKRNRESQQKNHEADLLKHDLSFKPLKLSYFILALKATLAIIFSTLLVIINLIQLQNAFADIELQAKQLHFVEKLNSNLILTASTFHTLAIVGNSAIIENLPLSTVIAEKTQALSKSVIKLAKTIQKNDVNPEFPQIQEIMFGDACAFLDYNPVYFSFCKQLASNQDKAGLVNLLSNFELNLNQFYSKYKSTADVTNHDTQVAFQLEVLDEFVSPAFIVTKPLCLLISDVLDKSLNSFMDGILERNNGMAAGLLIVLFGGWVVLCFLGVKRLREKENEFKGLLQLFPAEVVLSNFMLKSYVMKISKNDKLDSIRDFI